MKISYFFHISFFSLGIIISSSNLLAEDLPLNPELLESIESNDTSKVLPAPDDSPTMNIENAPKVDLSEDLVEEPVTIIEPEVVEPTNDSQQTSDMNEENKATPQETLKPTDEAASKTEEFKEELPEPKIKVMEAEEIEIENVAIPEPTKGKQTHVDSKGEAPHPITGIFKRSKPFLFIFNPPYPYQLINIDTGKRIAYVDVSQLSNDPSLAAFLNKKVTITGKLGKDPKGKHVKIEAYHIF